jgi:protein-S-isoprenylcysteine O-methyltransferase Ste14
MPTSPEAPREPARPRAPLGLVPPVWFLLALVATFLLARFTPLAIVVRWPWNLLGLVPVAAGLAVAIAGNQRFHRHGTSVIPFSRSSALVTDGVFRYTRNPMYLGLLAVLLGVVVALGAVSPLVVVAAMAVLLRTWFVLPEEALMREQFGEAYEAYRGRVRRWI